MTKSSPRTTTNGPFDNLLLACSGFSGGGVWVEFEGGLVQRCINGTWLAGRILDWGEGKLSFDPHRWHCTADWEGCRLVLAGYCIANDGQLCESDRKLLSGMCFELPGRRKRTQHEASTIGEAGNESMEIEDLPYSELKSGCEGPPLVGPRMSSWMDLDVARQDAGNRSAEDDACLRMPPPLHSS